MKPATKRALVVLAICAVCTATLVILWARGSKPLQDLEWSVEDRQMRAGRKTPMDDRLVFISIDKPLYDADFNDDEIKQEPVLRYLRSNYPWSRAVWARLIEKLVDAGAKVIVLDIVFANPSDPEGDQALKRTIEKYKDRIVLAYNISEGENDRGGMRQVQFPNISVIEAHGTNSAAEDDRLGYDNTWPDPDGIFRTASYRSTSEQVGHVLPESVILESLDARALRKFGAGNLIPPGFDAQRFRYTTAPGGFQQCPVGYVLSPKLWQKNYKNGEVFKDKLVMVGPAADIFHDEHDTPFVRPMRRMLGPEIHLNIINAALHREFLNEPSLLIQLFIIAMAGVSAAALCFLVQQALKRFALVIMLGAAYWGVTYLIFNRTGAALNIWLFAVPAAALISSSLTTLSYDYLLERLEKRRVRRTLERYVSRDVVKELLDNPQTFFNALGGVRKPVTILFSDIRGFTTLTESADSAGLVKQLNEYFQEMVAHVFTHQGSLDKFIGDAVMAVWGSIVSHGTDNDARNAVATALAMKRSLRKLNEDWKSRGMLELAFGIGINHGEVIVGNLGSSEKMELTVIGDPVNLASRLEGLTKEYHLDLLLGEQMAAFIGGTYILRTVDYVQVKGKTKPVDVFTVMGDGAAQTVSMPVWLARYEDGVRLYRERKFSEAAVEFQECLRKQPDDYLSSLYLKRCQALVENPPDESWDGVFVMTKK
jgi:adenylate cyclase